MKTRSTQKKRRRQTSPTTPAIALAKAGAPAIALATAGRRCHFTRTDGRRCQMLRTANHATLCLFHAKQEHELSQSAQDLSQELVSLSGNLNTATDLNHVLRKLFSLFAQRRISRRDAVAFAYIAQLLLQTLRSVKSEIQIVRGYDGWQEILATAVGAEEEEEEAETDEAEESDESDETQENEESEDEQEDTGEDGNEADPESPKADSAYLEGLQEEIGQRPTSLSELARMILARHAKSHGAPPPIRGSP